MPELTLVSETERGKKKREQNKRERSRVFCRFSSNYVSISTAVESTSNSTNAKCQANLNDYIATSPVSIFGPGIKLHVWKGLGTAVISLGPLLLLL